MKITKKILHAFLPLLVIGGVVSAQIVTQEIPRDETSTTTESLQADTKILAAIEERNQKALIQEMRTMNHTLAEIRGLLKNQK